MVIRTVAFMIVRRVLGVVGCGPTPDAKDVEIAVLRQYAKTLTKPNSRGRFRFVASMKDATNDRWRPYRLEAEQLPAAVLKRLDALAEVHRNEEST